MLNHECFHHGWGLTLQHDGVPYFKALNCSADQQNAPVSGYQMWCWRPEGHTTMASNAVPEELHGWVRILPTHRPVAECCQRKKMKKQPRTDQSAEIFWVDGAIKKISVVKNCFANMVLCTSHTALKGAFHTKSTCWRCSSLLSEKGNAFYHNSPHLRLQIQLSLGLAVFFTCTAK